MALMEWDSSFSVNVAEVDAQHQILVKMINTLNDAMKARKGKEVMGDIIDGLIDYAATHFSMEETYFEQFSYTGAFIHKKEHQKFVGRIIDFKKGFDAGKLMLSLDVLEFLKTWLIDHIKGSDKKYTRCFNENGLQ
jgi:hemerythrin